MSTRHFPTGGILVWPKGVYPKDALMVDGYDEDGRLLAHPLGGGFQYKINPQQAAELREVSTREREAPIFYRAKFAVEGIEKEFEGWTDGRLWNGWANPYFAFDEATLVASSMNGRYDRVQDAFITTAGEEEVWAGQQIPLDDGSQRTVYPLGASSWCWDEIESLI